MGAVHELEVWLEKGLDSDAQAIDGCLAKRAQEIWVQVVGVCLEGYLLEVIEGILMCEGIEEGEYFIWEEERGGAATDVNGLDIEIGEEVGLQGEFAMDGIEEVLFTGEGCGEMEVAVMTFLSAKGDVDIDSCHDYI